MRSISIKAMFFTSFGVMVALICALGMFSLSQFRTMASLNRYTNSTMLPGMTATASLDAELSTIRLSEAEHMLAAGPEPRRKSRMPRT